MQTQYKRLKYALYSINVSMSVVANLPPVLFLTFRHMYNTSYTFLGLLVLVNYLTQLGVDLVFSFFSHKFNISKTVKSMPYLTFLGLVIYGVYPMLFPSSAGIGLLVGTVIFSASAGFAEVLISPIIATIPSDDPDREMSKLHSVYAWGVIPVILITSLYILIFCSENWNYIVLFFLFIPLLSMILFFGVKIPHMKSPDKVSGVLKFLKNKSVWLCVAAIFFGGAAECTMSQWASSYLEKALSIPKIWGDIFGVSLFALMLATGRSLYAKYGTNIKKVLIMCASGATFCYLVAAISSFPPVGLAACALTGLCTSMLWPGSLVVASERFPKGGVMIYALMAAGGDFGASVVPWLIGFVTDTAMNSGFMISLASDLSLSPEQLGMKLGIFIAMLFPLAAIFTFIWLKNNSCKF